MAGANGKTPVYAPGGGGGGACGPSNTGGNGASGQVEILYSAASVPSWNVLRFLLVVPQGGDTDGAIVAQMQTNGSVAKCQLVYNIASTGEITMKGLASGGGTLFTAGPITVVNGQPILVSLELNTIGSTVQYRMQTLSLSGFNNSTGFASIGGANVLGTVSEVDVDPNSNLVGSSVGHIVVQYVSETITSLTNAINAWAGELAAARFLRLCAEEGVPAILNGNTSDTGAMGPQPDDTLVNVLQQVEDLDRGLLYEPVGQFGLGYRTYTNMTNQSPAVTVDYSLGEMSPPFQPTEDDQLTRNVVTVSRINGSSFLMVQSTGSLSNQNPPNGVGQYAYSIAVNANADSQLSGVAKKIIALGTADNYRYPQVTFDLTRPAVLNIFSALRAMNVGDFLQIINPPSFLTTATINQLVFGFSLTIQGRKYIMGVNCVPESPFEV